MASKIEKELRTATKCKQKEDEDRQAYLNRLALKVQDLPDADWEQLSDAAQEWTNAAAKAISAHRDIDEFDDGGGKPAKAEEDDDGDDAPSKKSKPAAKKPAAKEKEMASKNGKSDKSSKSKKPAAKASKPAKSAKPAAKAEKAEKAPKSRGTKEPSMRRTIKTMVVKKPAASFDELNDKLVAKGFKPTKFTLSSIRADTLDTMRVIQDCGLGKFGL